MDYLDKFQVENSHFIDYEELDKIINLEYSQLYHDSSMFKEVDSYYKLDVSSNFNQFDEKDLAEYLCCRNQQYNSTQLILNDLCRNNKINSGTYLIRIW